MSNTQAVPAGRLRTTALGVYLFLMALLLIFMVYYLWPISSDVNSDVMSWGKTVEIFGEPVRFHPEAHLILMVIAAAALGSYVHTATSFVSYVGNRKFLVSWTWWYMLRPMIGISLALVFYFVVRGGLLSAGAGADAVNPFGIAAVAGLVGMFSKQATDKLEELFDTLFHTSGERGDTKRGDKLDMNRPVKDFMIPKSQISAVTANEANDKDVTLDQLIASLKPGVTRIPVLDDHGVLRYLIHQSVLFYFKNTWKDSNQPTLADLAQNKELGRLISESAAFIPITATLGDAKSAMEALANCQDVFITNSGKKSEPVLGWLTNISIGSLSKV